MKHASQKKRDKPLDLQLHTRVREGLLILTSAVAIFLLIALATYHRSDPGWSSTGFSAHAANAGGRAGAFLSDILLYLFGYLAYLFPLMIAYSAWLFLRALPEVPGFNLRVFALRSTGFVLILAAGCAIVSLQFADYHAHIPFSSGGILGNVIGYHLDAVFNLLGATLLLLALFCSGMTLFTGLSWFGLMDFIGRWTFTALGNVVALASNGWARLSALSMKRREAKAGAKTRIKATPKISESSSEPSLSRFTFSNKTAKSGLLEENNVDKIGSRTNLRIEPKLSAIEPSRRAKKERQERQIPLFNTPVKGSLPPLSLLDSAEPQSHKGFSTQKLEQMSREVEARLKDFGVDVCVVAVHPGPVITRFEMELAPGIKVSRITGLAKDLARSLSVISVRIVEIIPGKPVVGLELPNENRETVRLSEVLSSQHYEQTRSPLALALGKDIAGHPVIVDLAKMPHLLVAGTTGSGKSVGLNAMLMGLLFKSTPEDIRMILVDPKMLELSIYEGIPHLLAPVVTDMKEAANALRWCVGEMERRYRLMAALGVRNISGFNHKIAEAAKKGEQIPDTTWQNIDGQEPPHLRHVPYVVVVIDEYADMMMIVGKKVEQLIARIAQKARAAGIHLILATQRPSVDVITGLIKANIPTRIAFQVSSKIDSRTVLDQGGAEQLLGHGDMLYLPPGTSVPVRVHGAFVADDEVHKLVHDWRRRGQPEYIEEITRGGSDEGEAGDVGSNGDIEDQDPLYDQAVEIVVTSRRASISSIQRRLKIGYNRAARLVEEMERTGIVSGMEGNGSREVLAPPPS